MACDSLPAIRRSAKDPHKSKNVHKLSLRKNYGFKTDGHTNTTLVEDICIRSVRMAFLRSEVTFKYYETVRSAMADGCCCCGGSIHNSGKQLSLSRGGEPGRGSLVVTTKASLPVAKCHLDWIDWSWFKWLSQGFRTGSRFPADLRSERNRLHESKFQTMK